MSRNEQIVMSRYENEKSAIHSDIGGRMHELRIAFEKQMAALEVEEAQRLAEAKERKNVMLGQVWAAEPIDWTDDEE